MHTQLLATDLADELQLVVAPFFVGSSKATRFVGDGDFPWNPDHRATLAEVRQIGDVVLPRHALVPILHELTGEPMADRLPEATIRTAVPVPLSFADGYATTALAFTFDGLADGLEHVALGLGDRSDPTRRARTARPLRSSASTASASPGTSSGASGATAARSCARPSNGSPRPGATCSTCGRRDAASASTPSSTPTSCRTRARHLPGQRGPRLRGGRARLRRRGPDAPRPRGAESRPLTNNPDKADQLGRLGITDEPRRDRGPPVPRQRPLPGHEGDAWLPHPRPAPDGWLRTPPGVRGRLTTRDEGEPPVHHRALHVDVPRRLHRRTERGPGNGLGDGGERLHDWVGGVTSSPPRTGSTTRTVPPSTTSCRPGRSSRAEGP